MKLGYNEQNFQSQMPMLLYQTTRYNEPRL